MILASGVTPFQSTFLVALVTSCIPAAVLLYRSRKFTEAGRRARAAEAKSDESLNASRLVQISFDGLQALSHQCEERCNELTADLRSTKAELRDVKAELREERRARVLADAHVDRLDREITKLKKGAR